MPNKSLHRLQDRLSRGMPNKTTRHQGLGESGWIRWLAVAILTFLALHSLSYGIGFLSDPTAGAGEFGADDPPTAAAENLAGLVGVILLLIATTAIIAAVMLTRRHIGGAWLAFGLGVSLFSIGLYWAFRDNVWDAGFYCAVGTVLALFGGLIAQHRFFLDTHLSVDEASQDSDEHGSA